MNKSVITAGWRIRNLPLFCYFDFAFGDLLRLKNEVEKLLVDSGRISHLARRFTGFNICYVVPVYAKDRRGVSMLFNVRALYITANIEGMLCK